MITAFEVGAIFGIRDEATKTLTDLTKKIRGIR
mgnify:CR=1 FL=1